MLKLLDIPRMSMTLIRDFIFWGAFFGDWREEIGMAKTFDKLKQEALIDLLNLSNQNRVEASTPGEIASYMTLDLGPECFLDMVAYFGEDLLDFVPEEHGLPPGSSLREVLTKYLALELESFLKVQGKRLPNGEKIFK